MEVSTSGSTSGHSDDAHNIDINFENIHYSVSVPKQKGEFCEVVKIVIKGYIVITYIF